MSEFVPDTSEIIDRMHEIISADSSPKVDENE